MSSLSDRAVANAWLRGEPLGGSKEEAYRQHAWGMYRCAVGFADSQVSRLFSWLQAAGEWPRTVVIAVADHGEEFGEQGGTGHMGQLSDPVLRVPLVIHVPGAKPRQIQEVVRNFDVHATILDYAGVPLPRELEAVSLRPFVENGRGPELVALASFPRVAVASAAGRFPRIRRRRWRLVARDAIRFDQYLLFRDDRGHQKLYDLRTDPQETKDLAADRAELARLIADAADRFKPRSSAAVAGRGNALDPATAEQLRALGYVQ